MNFRMIQAVIKCLKVQQSRELRRIRTACRAVYSCFEKGCPTKAYATMPIGIMGNGGLWYLIEALGVSAT